MFPIVLGCVFSGNLRKYWVQDENKTSFYIFQSVHSAVKNKKASKIENVSAFLCMKEVISKDEVFFLRSQFLKFNA